MILDTLPYASTSHPLSARFAAGLKWLETFKPETADGRYDIDGDNVFALVQSYDTVPADQKKFEAHRKYADIQYVANGTEVIEYAPLAGLKATMDFDTEKDYQLFTPTTPVTPLRLEPGSFAIFYPQDGHKPGCVADAAMKMKKVVIKVRVA